MEPPLSPEDYSNPDVATPLVWRLRSQELRLGCPPLVMGILNVTPDSFSDGGLHQQTEDAVSAALRMEDDGAAIIDIGGESTRPYSSPVAVDQELRRVVPVLERLAGRLTIPISIDTSKAAVAGAAIDLGAEIINDVTGLEGDAEMAALAAASKVGVCVMHMQGNPQTMQDHPQYIDVVAEICDYLTRRARVCLDCGIDRERICLDPGIGFGKTHRHNLTLIRNASRFCQLGWPILVGHSRKGFIGKVLGDNQRDRDPGTVGVSLAMALQGAHVLRVHNVRLTVDALNLFAACSPSVPLQ